MKPQQDLLSAAEACHILGVKPQTLYAYVSRGLIQVRAAKDRRESLYPRQQIETLKARSHARSGHGPTAASAMRFGDPILESAITLIQDQQLYYRGCPLADLIVDGYSFECVAELLWSGVLTRSKLHWSESETKREKKSDKHTEKKTSVASNDPASAIGRLFLYETARLASEDSSDSEESIDLAVVRARKLIHHAARSLSLSKNPCTSVQIADILADAVDIDPEVMTPILNRALIVSADHELNASTFAARIAASTGADLYSCMMAGLGAFAGPKHGISPIYVYQFLANCIQKCNVKETIKTHARYKKSIPGFGHTLYLGSGDPRAQVLLDSLRSLRPHLTKIRCGKLDRVEEFLLEADEANAGFPNLDLGLAALIFVLQLPVTWSAGLFGIGRMAGWTAHILEQRQQEFLLRPRARYVGRTPQ